MLAVSETYKGIKFVRISSLPTEQKTHIWKSINHDTIIKILKGETLLNDCIQYKHYVTWYESIYKAARGASVAANTSSTLAIAS